MHPTNIASGILFLWHVLELYGIDPEPLFREMALDPALLKQPGARYKVASIDNLWRKACEVIDDPCFGLKAGELWHPSYASALGYAWLASHTLREGFERLDRYYRFLTDERPMRFDETEKELTLTLIFTHKGRDIPERSDAILAVVMKACRLTYIEDLTPESVTFTHPRPSCSARFFEYFRSPVVFEAPTNSLTLPIDVVDKRLPTSPTC